MLFTFLKFLGSKLKILHICNNYISSKVHKELIEAISHYGDHFQYVYVPVRTKSDLEINNFKNDRVNIKYFNYRFSWLKYLPILKIFIIFLGILKCKPEHDVVIAHNFWSDGMLAFLNYIFFGKSYILVVRNTDMNVFLPKLRHYHWLIRLMVSKSNGMIFINKIYEQEFKKLYPGIYKKSRNNYLIFNGVNNFWLENSTFEDLEYRNNSNNLVYVGGFNKNKNILSVIAACEKVKISRPNLKLFLVGGNEDDLKKLGISKIPNYVSCLGSIKDKDTLKDIYRQSKIFIMPSFFETFGLVYIEALLQGCSIIHSKGQGVDGIFNKDFIKAVDPYNIDLIAEQIDFLLENFHLRDLDINFNCYLKKYFNWNHIAGQYLKVFHK